MWNAKCEMSNHSFHIFLEVRFAFTSTIIGRAIAAMFIAVPIRISTDAA